MHASVDKLTRTPVQAPRPKVETQKIAELKEALEADEPNVDTIKETTAALQTVAQKIGEEMRKKSDAAEGESADANKENVTEAEFKEKEAEKKEEGGGGKA